MIKKKSTLLSRRKAALIVFTVLVAVLILAAVLVRFYFTGTELTDPIDGGVYYIREKKQVYSLYDADRKTVMPTDEQYGYYITHAGTLIDVDAETGEYEIIAVVDTVESEQVGINQRVLMFPHLEKKNILKLEVFNDTGSFTFVRYNIETGKEDASSDFIILGSGLNAYDQELFASLHVSAGYTITTRKIKSPVKDAQGEFSEYGLVPEQRVREVLDEKGEFVKDENGDYIYETYDYTPAYYIITDTSGTRHKVIIGDKLVSGGGYYVQYVALSGESETKRDAVYVLSADIGDTLLAPIEDFVTPQLTYPMDMNTYLYVENFFIMQKNPNPTGEDDAYLDPVVRFSFVPLADREHTINVHTPYFFHKDFELDGYAVSTDNINTALGGLYQPAFGEVVKLAPTMEDFVKYGLAVEKGEDSEGKMQYELLPEYLISYNYDALDDNGNVSMTVQNRIYVSKRTDDGKYYVFTEIYEVDEKGKVSEDSLYDYNMIIEVQSHSLEFLNWDRFDWINESYISLNVAYADKITVKDHQSGYEASFDIDNSATDMTGGVSSTNMTVTASDSNGNSTTTFSQMSVVDESGNTWVITASEIKCYSPSGSELKITSSYYDYNKLDKQVRVNRGEIKCADGRRVTVNADDIEIKDGNGTRRIVRYHTDLFRDYFQTLLYASISDTYQMTEDEENALVSDESKLLVTLTVKDTEGGEKVYKFYRLTSRKAYITINGNGGFYVLADRVEKFVSDAQKFFVCELIDATSKY